MYLLPSLYASISKVKTHLVSWQCAVALLLSVTIQKKAWHSKSHEKQNTNLFSFLRKQVQFCSRPYADCLCLVLRPVFRLLPAGPLGGIWARTVWHRLLHWLAPVQSEHHGTLLLRGAVRLLLHPPMLCYCSILHRHSGHGAVVAQNLGAACVEANAHEQHPGNHC